LKTYIRILLQALLVTASVGGTALHARPLALWEIEGANNRVYLLGSAHLLRPSDYPLPTAMEDAYATADELVMEIDMDDLDPLVAQSTMSDMATDGDDLRAIIGDQGYAEAEKLASASGIDLAQFAPFEPWFAALMISQMRMTQFGFDPALGVEMHLAGRAQKDGKPVRGLETLTEQLGFMDQLDMDTQQLFLLESLKSSDESREELQTIIAAWRAGDMAALARLQEEMKREAPRLHDALFTQRNQNWLPKIIEFTKQDQDYLVIVGTMHLAGNEGLPALLKARGLDVRQLSE